MENTNDAHWERVERFVEQTLQEIGIPGCCVGVLHQGMIKTLGLGISNVERDNPVNDDTLFQIGSISKTFTATVALKLIEEGVLDLHTPVQTYLPDFRVADESVSAAVSVYHLLTHTAGWDGDLFVDTGEGDDAFLKYIQRMAGREQLFPLGAFFSYNNSGYAVLGAVLEAATGECLESLYRTTITEPLGLENVYFNAGEVIGRDYAVGHHAGPDGNAVARPWGMSRGLLSMGGIVTTARDLLRYARCYLEDGRTSSDSQMLNPETILEMFAPKVAISDDDRTTRGFSWIRRELARGYEVSHAGGTNGQLTQLSLFPEHDFALAIFTNNDQGMKLITKVHEYLVKTYLDLSIESPKAIDSSSDVLAGYAGRAAKPGEVFYLEMVGDYLVGLSESTVGFPGEDDPPPPPAPPFRIGRCAEDRLIVLDGDLKNLTVDVFRDPDGAIEFLRVFNRMYRFESKQ